MSTEPQVTHLYRYNDYPGGVVLEEQYRIVKRTPKGVWIELPSYPPKTKFVLTNAKKRFAHETLEGAKKSFFARKRRQLAILSARIDSIQEAVQAMKEGRISDYSKVVEW